MKHISEFRIFLLSSNVCVIRPKSFQLKVVIVICHVITSDYWVSHDRDCLTVVTLFCVYRCLVMSESFTCRYSINCISPDLKNYTFPSLLSVWQCCLAKQAAANRHGINGTIVQVLHSLFLSCSILQDVCSDTWHGTSGVEYYNTN